MGSGGQLRGFYRYVEAKLVSGSTSGKNWRRLELPEDIDVDWNVWRLLMSSRLKVTMRELREDYSFNDLARAHALLDAYDRVEAEAGE